MTVGEFTVDSVGISFNTIRTLDSNANLELDAAGTGKVSVLAPLITSGYVKLPIYANSSALGSAIPSPEPGMLAYLEDAGGGSPAVVAYLGSPTNAWTNL
jgi:hypothetical protein